MEGIKTGIGFFDSQAGGFHRGKPYLAFGASGTGKSILGLQFATAGLAQGEAALYVCREKADDLVQQGERLGLPLESYLDDERLVLLEYDHDFEEIVARAGPEDVLEELTSQTDASRVRRVVLDPVDPFFSSLDQESLLRTELRAVTGHLERLGWTPLLLCDETVASRHPYVLRVFSEVCWGLFELRRPEAQVDAASEFHQLLVYKMRNASLDQSKFQFRIGEGGLRGPGDRPAVQRPSFARFRKTAAPETPAAVEAPAVAPEPVPDRPEPEARRGDEALELLGDDDLLAMEQAATRRSDPAPAPTSRPSRPTVLVVDEDAAARSAVEHALASACEVVVAADGLEALELVSGLQPALVVVATASGRLNGIGLARLLRDHGSDVPILGLTEGHKRAGERVRCLMVGADDALPKPIEPELLSSRVEALLAGRTASVWPRIEAATAKDGLGPRSVRPEQLERELAQVVSQATSAEIPVSLLGYEFRFVSGEDVKSFADRFLERLSDSIRTEDLVCRHSDKRIVSVLVDADHDGARSVVQRVHEQMAAIADAFTGRVHVKPKALFRLLSVQPHLLDGEAPQQNLVARLFEQPARVIEEDLGDRPGEPMEKYPLLEAVFGALGGDEDVCVSPLDGASHAIREHGRVRSVSVGQFVYRTQDPREESPEGFRAGSGARIVWVEALGTSGRPVARIEEGRVFRGREA
jgi:KaiC/GvpD/RAD55 family RecA-like ATPase/DNA-binding response OmpR family regulator